jgi:nitrogen fixation protein NifU and related proteins
MYSKEAIKRFRNPKFAGDLKNPDGVGEKGNMRCGDVMKIFVKIEKDRIKDIRFQTYGCIGAISSSEAMCELAKGKKISEALKINYDDIIKKLGGLPHEKIHCSVLGTEALKDAINDYENKKNNLKNKN